MEQIQHSDGNEDMIKSGLRHITVLVIYAILVLWNLDAYSAGNSNKEIKINLTNLSKEDYLEFLFPLLPSQGYFFNMNYLNAGNISAPTIGTVNFYEGAHIIDDKEFYRLSSNAFDKSGKPFMLEWDISTGFFLDNRKSEAFKLTADMIFDAEDNDINTIFSKKLMGSDNIINVNPLYTGYNEIEKITGYEFNYTIRRSPTYLAVRTTIEIFAACSAGIINYFMTKEVNMVDWQYKYTWADAKRKFADGWYWDPNNFNTNTIYHLYAGSSYYLIARSNYYSIPASFAWSFGGSLFWEYFGEWREQVSLNDMIFTPTLGALTGEVIYQAGNFIERNMQPGFFRETILLIINPFGWVNKRLDSSNTGDVRVRLIFVNPIQTAVEKKILY